MKSLVIIWSLITGGADEVQRDCEIPTDDGPLVCHFV